MNTQGEMYSWYVSEMLGIRADIDDDHPVYLLKVPNLDCIIKLA